ncbi:MAG: NAD(P)H-hydrate epimerase, partial [Longimicrobiales bacterium]|nr:NAD(P)H-hydrate epimerase [Longimicrobiales bacterium]
LQMMEHAGRSLAEVALQTLAEVALRVLGRPAKQSRVVVLAGTGGNGGGGICAARHLVPRVGEVRLCVTDPDALTGAPRAQWETYQISHGWKVDPSKLDDLGIDLVIDAVLGYGLVDAPRGKAREMIEWANDTPAPVVSLDLPSGIDADTGEMPGVAIRPRATLTLALPKAGLARAEVGELWLADLGIPGAIYRRVGVEYRSPFGSEFIVPLVRGPRGPGDMRPGAR